jgi:D-threonate/D-erythronate kinase
MLELVVIADDLTGALDAAGPFAMRGLATAVAVTPAALGKAIASGARIVGISTDSRDLSASRAREVVGEVMAALPHGLRIFKKVDSRLKGNIEAELDAIPHRRSLVVPAIPVLGRWVSDGRVRGFGVAEPIDIRRRLGHHAEAAQIPAVSSQADIDTALAAEFDLLVGARGLAEAIARSLSEAMPEPAPLSYAGAFCVIGSIDPITLAQLDALRAQATDAAYIAAPDGKASESLPRTAPLTIIQAVAGVGSAGSEAVAAGLADTLVRLAPPPGSLLVISGGATAQIVLNRLGIDVLEVLGEAMPGLPISRGGGLTVVTKSGGFGDKDTLRRLFSPILSRQERIA